MLCDKLPSIPEFKGTTRGNAALDVAELEATNRSLKMAAQ